MFHLANRFNTNPHCCGRPSTDYQFITMVEERSVPEAYIGHGMP